MPNIKTLLLIFLLISFFLNCNKDKKTVDKIIASVNGENITLSEVENELKYILKTFINLPPLKKSEKLELKKTILNRVIEKKIIFQEIKKLNITISEEKLDNKIKDILGNYSHLRLKETLESKNITFKEWNKKIKNRLLIEELVSKEIKEKIIINDEMLNEYYNSFPKEFYQQLSVRVLQIVVEKESEAREIKKQIEKGADFSNIARVKSLSPDSKKGGDLGFFSKGQMPKEFDQAVFNLKVGEISEVVQTLYGYHIFKLLEKKETKQNTFIESKKKIYNIIMEKKQKEKIYYWMKNLKENSEIIITW